MVSVEGAQRISAVFLTLAAAVFAQSQTPISRTAPSYEPYAYVVHHGAPAWSPDDREIFYSVLHIRKTSGHLQRVSSSGGTGRRVFSNDTWTAAGEWSPDGKRLVFAKEDADGKHLWTADARGKDLRQVTHGAGSFDHTPSWSPDGSKIAWTSLSDDSPAVMVASADGSSAKKLAAGFRPRFSPNGQSIAYTAPVPKLVGEPFFAVYIKDVGNGEPRQLKSTRGPTKAWPSGADWSPDGRQIVFVRHLQHGSELLLVNVETDTIVRTIPLDGIAHDPAWSHDGKRIAFMLQASDHAGEIHSLRLDIDKSTPVTRQEHYAPGKAISYPSADGASVSGYLFQPVDYKHSRKLKARAGLIWVHGGEPGIGAADDTFHADIQYFVDQGFVVIAPDFRPGNEVADLTAAARFLSEKTGVPSGRISLVGFSFGAFLSLLTAARSDVPFAAVVDFFGPTDLAALYQDARQYRGVISRRVGGTPEEKPEQYRELSPLSLAPRIKPPVLILHGTADQLIPISHSMRLAEALKTANKEVRFVTLGSGHGFSVEDDLTAFPEAASFLLSHLQS